MKYVFTEELDVTEWERWEVDAESLDEACRKFHRLRYEDCECGEVVNGKIHSAVLVEVTDEAGTKYDPGLAKERIGQEVARAPDSPPLTKEEVAEALGSLLAEGLIEVVGYNEGGEAIYDVVRNEMGEPIYPPEWDAGLPKRDRDESGRPGGV